MTRSRASTNERRLLVALSGVILIAFGLLAVWARFWSPAPWEPGVLDALALKPGLGGDVVHGINTIGNLPIWALVVAVAAALLGATRGISAALLIAVSFASDVAAFIAKLLVERDRPETAAVEQFFGADSFAYPSGHTVRAAAFTAAVVWLITPVRWRLPLAVLGALIAGLTMGYARVALGVHWPTDTIGGTLLGIGWFAASAALVLPRIAPALGGR